MAFAETRAVLPMSVHCTDSRTGAWILLGVASPTDPDLTLVETMTQIARGVVATPDNAYWLAIEGNGALMPVVLTARHGGAAYVLWASLSDIQDDPRGPQDDALCVRQTTLAASEWLASDNSPDAVDAYFERWAPSVGTGSAWVDWKD